MIPIKIKLDDVFEALNLLPFLEYMPETYLLFCLNEFLSSFQMKIPVVFMYISQANLDLFLLYFFHNTFT